MLRSPSSTPSPRSLSSVSIIPIDAISSTNPFGSVSFATLALSAAPLEPLLHPPLLLRTLLVRADNSGCSLAMLSASWTPVHTCYSLFTRCLVIVCGYSGDFTGDPTHGSSMLRSSLPYSFFLCSLRPGLSVPDLWCPSSSV